MQLVHTAHPGYVRLTSLEGLDGPAPAVTPTLEAGDSHPDPSADATLHSLGVDNVAAANEHVTSIQQRVHDLSLDSLSDSQTAFERSGISSLGLHEICSGLWNNIVLPVRSVFYDVENSGQKLEVEEKPDLREVPIIHCPAPEHIHALLQAMVDLARKRSVTLASVRTPKSTAAWTIAFVRWCLGYEPTVYCLQRNVPIVIQTKSNFIVEVDEQQSSILVQTFTTHNSLYELFRNQAGHASTRALECFGSMVNIKTQFVFLLHELHPYCEPSKAVDCLLVMASMIGDLKPS